MSGKIIVITGYLASGKSTFAARLSKALSIPYFIKDTFKSALCSGAEDLIPELGSRFSAMTFDGMMYAAERCLETGTPVIIEGNFVPRGVKKKDEAGTIKSSVEKYGGQSLTYKFTGDTKILYKRFIEREKLPGRGAANRMPEDYKLTHEMFNTWCVNLDAFDIGGTVIKIDTTDFMSVDFESYIKSALDWMKELL